MLRSRACLLFLCALCVFPAAADGSDSAVRFHRAIESRLEALQKTEALLGDKLVHRRRLITQRVRALYKLSRAGTARVWVDRAERASAPRRRAALRLLLSRELRELRLLRREEALADKARARLENEREAALPPQPAPGSLFRAVVDGAVVRGFGPYTEPETGAKLSSRGIELAAHPGRNVRAVAAGVVRWTGDLHGLGRAAVVEHRKGSIRFTSVLGRLGALTARAGDRVERGQKLGEAAGSRVYLEIRLPAGAAGFPIDPEPLLAP